MKSSMAAFVAARNCTGRIEPIVAPGNHERIDVQLCQVSSKVHGEVRHAHQGRIVSAVAPYREAREAVVAALRDLDAASAAAPMLEGGRCKGGVVDG